MKILFSRNETEMSKFNAVVNLKKMKASAESESFIKVLDRTIIFLRLIDLPPDYLFVSQSKCETILKYLIKNDNGKLEIEISTDSNGLRNSIYEFQYHWNNEGSTLFSINLMKNTPSTTQEDKFLNNFNLPFFDN